MLKPMPKMKTENTLLLRPQVQSVNGSMDDTEMKIPYNEKENLKYRKMQWLMRRHSELSIHKSFK